MGYLYNTLGCLDESYRRGMRAIKESEQLTPKEYGIRIQNMKKKKKKRKSVK